MFPICTLVQLIGRPIFLSRNNVEIALRNLADEAANEAIKRKGSPKYYVYNMSPVINTKISVEGILNVYLRHF